MKKIYDLAVTLAQDPAQVTDAQALTLDDTRPGFGLKGVYGLFAPYRIGSHVGFFVGHAAVLIASAIREPECE